MLKYSEDKSSLANENIRLWIRSFLCVSISLDTKSSVQQVKYILEWLQRDLLVYFSREELFWIIQQFLKVTEFWMGVYQYQKALSWIELAIFFIRMWKEGVVFPHEVAELQSLLQDIDLRFYQEILGQLG